MLCGADAIEVLAGRDAFWRVADDPRGDMIALAVLAAAFVSVLATIVCALRACSLVRGACSTRRRRRPLHPVTSAVTAPPPLPLSPPQQQQQPPCLPTRPDESLLLPPPPPSHAHQQQRRQVRVPWEIKWASAIADEKGAALARIEARKVARRDAAASRERPLPRSVLLSLNRTSAHIAALPGPH
ncbi:hypothetical protein pdul_cds_34 [Pandoravirus dulcis]|uniref:Uncharacterized protein n=1 Tax=Pandoravirus dulcis TaxID=1349409 RepID=S4VUZ9_9VIRU|nr:hypothetical protein pdul_cds_34 [Pandoravirus dulcis]AGO81911.1 hypothetical protein pdul_cds_34 [Pandoravirus dulcis]